MPIYRLDSNQIIPIKRTTFAQQGMRERDDLQALLKAQIGVISPDTLVVAEEYVGWEDSRRRIDLLGIDKKANLVVIELKRTEGGGHIELQVIRYAEMVSALTFDRLVEEYEQYLRRNGLDEDATANLLEFLGWEEPDEEQFGQEVRTVLASADFSKELTTSVMWLNELGLDIRCVRMDTYTHNGETLLDVQRVIPVPEVSDYQARIREKKQKEQKSRGHTRDYTKYDVDIAGKKFPVQHKRWMMFHIVSGVLENGGTPEQVMKAVHWRKIFEVLEGELGVGQVYRTLMEKDTGGKLPRAKRFFCDDGELFPTRGKTYVLTNQWGGNDVLEAAGSLQKTFPELNIEFKPGI